jgi:hypothetical protein
MPPMEGVDTVLKNLRREIKAIEGRITRQGLAKAGIIIRRSAIRMTPVDTGNLRSSFFTRPFTRFNRPSLVLGYAAKYAAIVHERTHTKSGEPLTFNKKTAQPKFLEEALRRTQKRVLKALQESARIK